VAFSTKMQTITFKFYLTRLIALIARKQYYSPTILYLNTDFRSLLLKKLQFIRTLDMTFEGHSWAKSYMTLMPRKLKYTPTTCKPNIK